MFKYLQNRNFFELVTPLGQYVVLPYGLNWLAAGVEDVTPQPNEVQILYLYF